MKTKLLLSTVLTAELAVTAMADIGWSLKECKQHWGAPLVENSYIGGILSPTFLFQNCVIEVMIENDAVICASYSKVDMTDQEVEAIRNANGKDWVFSTSSGGNDYWVTPDGLMAVIGYVAKIHTVFVCQRKDLPRLMEVYSSQKQ